MSGEEGGELVDGGGHGERAGVHAAQLHLRVHLLAQKGPPQTPAELKLSVGSGIESKPFDQSDRTNPNREYALYPVTLQEQSASQPITLRAIRVTGHPLYTEYKVSLFRDVTVAGRVNSFQLNVRTFRGGMRISLMNIGDRDKPVREAAKATQRLRATRVGPYRAAAAPWTAPRASCRRSPKARAWQIFLATSSHAM